MKGKTVRDSTIQLLHLHPKDVERTGIASYALLVEKALKKYYPEEVSITSFGPDEVVDIEKKIIDKTNFIVLAEIGINEGNVFRAIRNNQLLRTCKQRVLTIHDPPHFVNSPFYCFEYFSKHKAFRAFRRALNYLLKSFVIKTTFHADDTFICLTESGTDQIKRKVAIKLKQEPAVIHIPQLNYLDDDEINIPCSSSEKPLTFGMFGFIAPHKGMHTIIDSIILLKHMLPDEKMPMIIIRGKPGNNFLNYYNIQKKKIEQNGLEQWVNLGGFLPEEELPEFINQLDALMLPYTNTSTFAASGPAMWARTFAKPVIASNSPVGQANVINKVDGLIIDSDPKNWADTIYSLVRDYSLLTTLKDGARARQKLGSWCRVSKHYMDMFRKYGAT